jgi:hypothetical protein
MKAIIFFILFSMLAIPTVFGQIKIGDNPQNIDPASVLELESSSKVLVITRVSSLEMEAITPQRGGLVYNTDTECINYYDGTQWINLCDAVNFTITNDPIINNRATIEITQTASGYNLEIAKDGILGDNIVDGGIGPDDIQDNSISQDKLTAESVGSSEIRQNAVGSDEIRDGSIAPTDMANFIPGQVLITDENGIVLWGDAGDLMGAIGDEITITGSGTPAAPLQITEGVQLNISNNTALIADHIANDQDTDDTNELIDLSFTKLTNTLSISQSATPIGASVDLSGLVGSDDQQLSLVNNILTLEEGGTPIDLTTYVNSDNQNLGTATLANEQLTINIQNGNPTTANLSAFATDAVVTAGLALKENIANKNPNINLGNSNVDYPTQNAVKVYVDTEIADVVTSGGSDPINEQNQIFDVVAGELIITDVAGTLAVPLTLIDTNTQLTDAQIGAFGYIKTDLDQQTIAEVLIQGNNAGSNPILGLAVSIDPTSAATRGYVDANLGGTQDLTGVLGNGSSAGNNQINDLLDPTLAQDAATKAYVDANSGTTTLTNGTILVGFTGNVPTERSVGGDATMNNLGQLTITNGAINSVKIANGTILAEDLNQMGAVVNQVLKWNGTIWAPAADVGGNNQTLTQVLTINNSAGGLGITNLIDPTLPQDAATKKYVDDIVVSGGGGVPTDELNQSFVVNGLNLELTDAGGTIQVPLNQINTDDADADATNELSDITLIGTTLNLTNSVAGAIGVDLDPTFVTEAELLAFGTDDADADPTNELSDISLTGTTLNLTNPAAGAIGVDLDPIFTTETEFSTNLVLKENTANKSTDVNLADATNVLFPTELAVKTYVDNQVGAITAPTIVSADADNSITESATDGGAYYDDAVLTAVTAANSAAILLKEDAANKSTDGTLADNSDNDFPTEQAVKTYVDGQISGLAIGDNLANANLTLDANRVHQLAGFNLSFDGTGNIGIGNLPGAPQDKLDVDGQIRARVGFGASNGTALLPSIGFYNDPNTGMFRGAADEIGFSVGGFEALRIDEPTAGNTNVIVNQSLELNNLLLDKDGQSGTGGQILSSTGTQTDWIDTSTLAADWTTLSNIPPGFADGTDDDTNLDEAAVDAFVSNNGFLTAEIDGSITNEIQTISSTGNTISLSNGGGFATITPVGNSNITSGTLVVTGGTNSVLNNVTIEIAVGTIGLGEIGDNAVGTDEIVNGSVGNVDVGFGIDGAKIIPNFLAQNIITTGNVNANSFISATATYPDFVFQKYFLGKSTLNTTYEFSPLDTVEAFLKKYHHLPGVKSVDEVKANDGQWNLTEGALINLEKIEELFLHTIEQEKKIKELESSNKNMATEVEALKAQMEEIKKLLLEKSKE